MSLKAELFQILQLHCNTLYKRFSVPMEIFITHKEVHQMSISRTSISSIPLLSDLAISKLVKTLLSSLPQVLMN